MRKRVPNQEGCPRESKIEPGRVLRDAASAGGRQVIEKTTPGTWELASSGGAPVGVQSRDGESSAGTQASSSRKKKHYLLYDKVCTKRNLWQAWLRVRANKGAPGCDGVSIEQYDASVRENLKELRRQLRAKTYRPRPVRRRPIPKPGGGVRNLGIPCVRDRLVQQALKQVLEPIFERKFTKHSHGFRPGKGVATACQVADWAVAHGYEWVVDLDLKDFFDTVDHELLLDAVNEEVADGSVLRLLRQILKSGMVLPSGEWESTNQGTPQGGPVSPLLANIYLHHFDVVMLEQGRHPLRYADDCLLFAKSQQEAERALAAARQVLEQAWNLTLHPTKTQIVSLDQGFDFLGFRYFRDRHGKLQKIVREKSIKGFRQNIRQRTRRHAGQRRPKTKKLKLSRLRKNRRIQEMIRQVNAYLKGWHWHFKHARTSWTIFRDFDQFVRRRVRSAICGRWAGTRYWNIVMPNSLLRGLGLLSLEELQRQYQLGLLQAPHSSCYRGGSRMG